MIGSALAGHQYNKTAMNLTANRSTLVHGSTLLACLLFAASCVRPADEPAEIKVGVIASLSGTLAETVGRSVVEGARLAVEHAHARGGLELDGRRYQIELLMEDAMDRPETAVQAARKLINQDHVPALVGPILSRNALDVAVVAESSRTPMISPTSTHPQLTAGRRYVFRATFTDDLQGWALARFAREDLKASAAAVLYDSTSAHNRWVAEIFQQAFSSLGGRVAAVETYTSGERDFRRPLGRIRDAQPDVLLLPNYIDDLPLQVQQAGEIGLASTFLGSDAWAGLDLPGQEGFDQSFFTDEWHPGVPELATATSRAFVQAYREAHDRVPNPVVALTYDAMGLLFAAIERSAVGPGSTLDGDAIRRELAMIEDYRGVTGTLSFKGGGDPIKGVTIFEIRNRRLAFERWIEP